jgi:hypothetical protein
MKQIYDCMISVVACLSITNLKYTILEFILHTGKIYSMPRLQTASQLLFGLRYCKFWRSAV